MRLELAGEAVELLAPAGLWWAAGRTLLVADPHIGKAAAFRRSGIPAPEASTGQTLDRVDAMLDRTGAERLAILGDLLHARAGRTPETLATLHAWRERRACVEMVLVRGNHDRSAGDPPASLGLGVVEPGEPMGPFALGHEPESVEGAPGYGLVGHVHPAVRVADSRGRSSPRFPCLWIRAGHAVLPAVGSFTGTKLVHADGDERVIAIVDGAPIDVTPAARSRGRRS